VIGMGRRVRLSAACGLALLLSGCMRSPPTLVDNLIEGMTEREAIVATGVAQSAFRVVAETNLREGDPRPPYSLKVLRADRVLCVGQLSEVSLSFYVKKLHIVSCYPKDVDAMIDALIKASVISTRGRDFSVARSGVAISSHEIDGRWCVTFVSERLSAEERRWNMRYS
jgi:hypothetical protein